MAPVPPTQQPSHPTRDYQPSRTAPDHNPLEVRIVEYDTKTHKYTPIIKRETLNFRGPRFQLPSNLEPSPRVLSELYFPDDMIDHIVHCSNEYALKKVAPGRFSEVTPADIYRFMAAITYMGIVKLPAKEDYFPPVDGWFPPHPHIKLTKTRFHYIWQTFHPAYREGDPIDDQPIRTTMAAEQQEEDIPEEVPDEAEEAIEEAEAENEEALLQGWVLEEIYDETSEYFNMIVDGNGEVKAYLERGTKTIWQHPNASEDQRYDIEDWVRWQQEMWIQKQKELRKDGVEYNQRRQTDFTDQDTGEHRWYTAVKNIMHHVNRTNKLLCIAPGQILSLDEMLRLFKGRY